MGSQDLSALFGVYYERLFKYLRRAVGDRETARDLAQEVFLRAVRRPIPPTSDGQTAAWLFRIARNLAVDYFRGKPGGRTEDVTDTAVRSASQDVDLAVAQALAGLAQLDRDVFLMREVAGLGYEEIAAACDVTPDAVRSRIHRTRLLLRDRLAAPIATSRTFTTRTRESNMRTLP
jgi:RNA polymerase sigma-70 factor (ECF subfamily)